MKKTFLLLACFNALTILAAGKVRIDLESKVEGNYNGKMSIKYIPIDLKVSSRDRKYTFFFKARGERDDIRKPNDSPVLINGKMTKRENLDDFIKEKSQNQEPISSSSISSLSEDHYHGPHEHDELIFGHSHGFFEDFKGHEHKHDKNVLNLDTYAITNSKEANDDFQYKLGFMYMPDRLSKFKFTLFPGLYNGDERRYNKSIVLDFEKTKKINDKFAIVINPKITTFDYYKPALLENKTYFKYELKKDTVLTAYLYNAVQTNIKEKEVFKNSINLIYDYNTEKHKGYKFYEILDHEHEKIDQLKFDLRLSHKGAYLKNPLKDRKTKYDIKKDKIDINFNFVYKKTNFLKEGLVFSNDLQLDTSLELEKTNNRKYNITRTTYKEKDFKKEGSYKRSYKNWHSEDESIFEDYHIFEYENGKKEITVDKGVSTNPSEYTKKELEGEILLENKTKIEYKKYKLENKLNLKKNLRNLDATFGINEIKLSYQKEFPKKIFFEPSIKLRTDFGYIKNVGIFYTKNEYGLAFDLHKKIEKNNLKSIVGLEAEVDLISEKRKIDSENGKTNITNYGNGFFVKPYLGLEYKFNKNIKINAKTFANYTYLKEADEKESNYDLGFELSVAYKY